jgi:hypothetical protein
MDIRAIVESTLVTPMREQARQASLDAACNRIGKLESVLRQIVHEYDQTYDGDCNNGHWTVAASIPVEVMERAKDLLK